MSSHRAPPLAPAPALALALSLFGCATEVAFDTPYDARGPDDPALQVSALAEGTLRLNDVYYATPSAGFDGTNLFSTSNSQVVLRRLAPQAAMKIVIAEPANGRYRVDHAGTLGWIAGTDLTLRHRYNSALSLTRINALARARNAMGFSYWWSNARWPTTGATTFPTRNTGTCSGVCGGEVPCVHAATGGTEYGSDCSGLISTIWGFPDYDSTTNPTNNGFSTKAYNKDHANWSTVPLKDAIAGDAVVKTGHIALISNARDSRDRFTTYECRGCANGCMTFRRTIADDGVWHAIRRTGWGVS